MRAHHGSNAEVREQFWESVLFSTFTVWILGPQTWPRCLDLLSHLSVIKSSILFFNFLHLAKSFQENNKIKVNFRHRLIAVTDTQRGSTR